MRLSVLRGFVDTLTEDGASPLAVAAVARWGHDPGSLRYVRASANAVFTFRRGDRALVIRLTPPGSRSVAELEAECGFVEHLAARGVPVACPVRSVRGSLVESGSWHAVVFDRLSGEHREVDELTPEGFTRWGRALGSLHRAAQGWPGDGRPAWSDLVVGVPDGEVAARRALAVVTARLARLPVDDGSFGVIHGDFELDNLLWQPPDGAIGIVDVDGCARHWFAADIAFALRDLFGDRVGGVDLNDSRLRQFVEGYRAARPLPDAELELLPLFLRLHQLGTFATLLRTVDIPDDGALPAWLHRLRSTLLAKIDFYRHEFTTDT